MVGTLVGSVIATVLFLFVRDIRFADDNSFVAYYSDLDPSFSHC